MPAVDVRSARRGRHGLRQYRTATTSASSDPRECEASTRRACSGAGTPGISDEPKSAATPSVAITRQSPGASVVRTQPHRRQRPAEHAAEQGGGVDGVARARGPRARAGPRRCRSRSSVSPPLARSNQASVATTPRVERSASWQRFSSGVGRLAGVRAAGSPAAASAASAAAAAVPEAVDRGDERAALVGREHREVARAVLARERLRRPPRARARRARRRRSHTHAPLGARATT